ncbi:MAG: L-aspartate oxidase [Deltaproteobacteria bacterium]|nr:L-aspartate oxidase [Deltaproteobacteria bacterium]
MPKIIDTDYLVIGSGLAGLYFASHASKHGKVTIVTKRSLRDGTTVLAQAGIASVLGDDDSFEAHVNDTLITGAGLCNEDVVRLTVESGPDRIKDLVDNFGVVFSGQKEGKFDLGLEGGHTKRRVVHIEDFTGEGLMARLEASVRRNTSIRIIENTMAVDLLSMSKYGGGNSCFGAFVLDRETNTIDTIIARSTIIASGGAGKVYLYTSNPDTSVGDGIALAYRAGAEIENMEFYQFHPTCLYHPNAKSFLISEALRGEGGVLRRMDGTAFMSSYHSRGELAPRDVVARAIDSELKKSGDDSALLDMTHLDGVFLEHRFPNIFKKLIEFGIDMRESPIPVVPAAHYSCGGIAVDQNGRTNIQNLFAIGEASHTGLHGACRMASNSLLEALVFAHRASDAVKECELVRPGGIIPWKSGHAVSSDEGVVVSQNWDEIRRTMWNYVGIVRSDRRLARAKARIDLIRDEIRNYYWDFLVTPELLELRNLALVADIIVHGAQRRQESRGLHYNLDHPEKSDFHKRSTVLFRGVGPCHS